MSTTVVSETPKQRRGAPTMTASVPLSDTTERILDALHLFPGKAAAATAAASSDGVSGGMNDLEKKKANI